MEQELAKRLEGFERVWKRVGEAKRGDEKPAIPLMPKKERKSGAVRFGPRK